MIDHSQSCQLKTGRVGEGEGEEVMGIVYFFCVFLSTFLAVAFLTFSS